MRALLFTIWLRAGKDIIETINLVELMSVAQFDVMSRGGSRMVQASVGGQTYQYELPANWSISDFIESLREIYKTLMLGGASGGQMTDTELSNFCLDSSDQVTNVTKARFAHNAGGRF